MLVLIVEEPRKDYHFCTFAVGLYESGNPKIEIPQNSSDDTLIKTVLRAQNQHRDSTKGVVLSRKKKARDVEI